MTTRFPICGRTQNSSNSRASCAGTGQVLFASTPPCRESAVAYFPHVGNIPLDIPATAVFTSPPQGAKIDCRKKPCKRRLSAREARIMKIESPSYRQHRKPERAMAEIRRTLLRKISTQINREGLPGSPFGPYPDRTAKIGEVLPRKAKLMLLNLACKTSMPPKQS